MNVVPVLARDRGPLFHSETGSEGAVAQGCIMSTVILCPRRPLTKRYTSWDRKFPVNERKFRSRSFRVGEGIGRRDAVDGNAH